MADDRWGDPREYDARDPGHEWPRVYDPRDRDEHDPRDGPMPDLDLPRRRAGIAMDVIDRAEQGPEPISVARHAETLAHVLIDVALHDVRVHLAAVARRRTLPASDVGPKLPEMVGAAIYVRVSTKGQTENLSLPTQLRACEEYCSRHGFQILQRFHEQGERAPRPRTAVSSRRC